jgi:hypothetical protein
MLVIVSPDILVNQLKRDSVTIAESFDRHCSEDVGAFSALFAQASAITLSGLHAKGRKNTELQTWSVEMLINVGNSLSAAVLVLRAGYSLTPGIILRNAVEAMAVCIHGLQCPQDLQKIKDGSFNTPAAVTTAKKVILPFGQMYGLLSDQFTHISPLHQSIKPLLPYEAGEPGLVLNLKTLRAVMWLYYIVVEFAFIDLLDQPRYWHREPPNKAIYNPSKEEQAWLQEFLHGRDNP